MGGGIPGAANGNPLPCNVPLSYNFLKLIAAALHVTS